MLTPEQIASLPPDTKKEYLKIIKTPRRHDKRPMNLKKFIFSLKN